MSRFDKMKKEVEKRTGYSFHGDAYLCQAFTRASVSGRENNEIFEMYGDAILGCYVMQIIHERLGFFRTDRNLNYKGDNGYALRGIRDEKDLNNLKAKLVCNEMLARQIDEWGLAKYLQMGKSDQVNHVDQQMKIKADLFEAILGAIAVSCKFNANILKDAVEKMLPFDEVLEQMKEQVELPKKPTLDNAVTYLKELAEKKMISEPRYEFSGPDSLGYYPNGDPQWCCTCQVDSVGEWKPEFSNSKSQAKKQAAYFVLCKYLEYPML